MTEGFKTGFPFILCSKASKNYGDASGSVEKGSQRLMYFNV